MKSALAILMLVSSLGLAETASARNQGAGGMTLDMSIGRPIVTLKNPDGALAYYEGVSTNVSIGEPLFEISDFSFRLVGSFRYFDLKNTNSSPVTETAQLIGPLAGVELGWRFLFVGYDYGFMAGRHQAVGPISKSIQYTFTPSTLKLGLSKRFQRFSLGVVYTRSEGNISSDQTKLGSDTPFSESAYWFNVRVDFGEGVIDVIEKF